MVQLTRSGTSYNAMNTNALLYMMNGIIYQHELNPVPLSLAQQQKLFNMLYNMKHKRPAHEIMHPGVLTQAAKLLHNHGATWNNNQRYINASKVPKKRLWPRNLEDPISLQTLNNWKGNQAIEVGGARKFYFSVPAFNKWFKTNWRRMPANSNAPISNRTHPVTRKQVLRKNVRLVQFIGSKPPPVLQRAQSARPASARRSPLRRTQNI